MLGTSEDDSYSIRKAIKHLRDHFLVPDHEQELQAVPEANKMVSYSANIMESFISSIPITQN